MGSGKRTLASEPLEDCPQGWQALPRDMLVCIENGEVTHNPIRVPAPQIRLAS